MAALATLLARDQGEKLWTKEDSPVDESNLLAPMFVTQPHDLQIYEGQSAHFDCRVEPTGDGSMRSEWFHDGKPIQVGSRTHTLNDFGFVVLDIDWTFKRDSGVYKCVVTNKCGSVECTARLNVISKKEAEEEFPANQSTMCMVHMEKAMKKYTTEMVMTEDDVFDAERNQPPRFMSQMRSNTHVAEMSPAKFECQLAPVGDPSMRVEWFFNGKPLIAKTQFQLINDFGYVALNFGWVYKQDSGEYMVRATNKCGSAELSANLVCSGPSGINYDTQLPKEMKSLEQIHEMEMKVVQAYLPDREDDTERSKPCFMTKPEAVVCVEGTTARFCCRVTGYPKPRVMWLINGQTIINGSRRKLTFDGMWHLEIPKCRESGKIEVIARNQLGEAYATTTLKLRKRRDDFRGILNKKESLNCQEFIERAEYRKPDWLVQMEMIKERLAAIVQNAKITKEIQTNRIKEGTSTEFTAGFAGNPQPEVAWFYNGNKLEESDRVKITTNTTTSTLHMDDCTMEMDGVYECRIDNKLGSDKTKASLIISPQSD